MGDERENWTYTVIEVIELGLASWCAFVVWEGDVGRAGESVHD